MPPAALTDATLRVGAVNYLNTKPLVHRLGELAPACSLLFDLPSRLSDSLAAARLDIALIPVVEYLRGNSYELVSDACIASQDEVRSVKLFFRVPPDKVTSLALDEGSRTSAALAQVLLAERCGVRPRLAPLPIGDGPASASEDAVLVIGDRAMTPPPEGFQTAWDLGAEWRAETGLPFVFAVWAARAGVDSRGVASALSAARDAGLADLRAISEQYGPPIGVSPDAAYEYLHDHLHYRLDAPERDAMRLFESRCRALGLLTTVDC